MTMEGVDPAQLRALRDLAQLCKDRDLAALSQARGVVSEIQSRLARLDTVVETAKTSAQGDAVSLAVLDVFLLTSQKQREGLMIELARARVRESEAQQRAVRSTGQVEVLEQMQGMHAEEIRLAKARRDLA